MGDGVSVHHLAISANRTALLEEALRGFDPNPVAARVVRAITQVEEQAGATGVHFLRVAAAHHERRVLAVVERVVGRLYQLGHEPVEVDNDEAELAMGTLVEVVKGEHFEGSPNVAGLYHIDSIVGWGTLNKSRANLLRALRWQMIARAADCLFGV